jgi:hypothetical protein
MEYHICIRMNFDLKIKVESTLGVKSKDQNVVVYFTYYIQYS